MASADRAFACDLMILLCFYYPVDKLSEFPGRRACAYERRAVYICDVIFSTDY